MEQINSEEWYSTISDLYTILVEAIANSVVADKDGQDIDSTIAYVVDTQLLYTDQCLIGANYFKETGEWDYEIAMNQFIREVEVVSKDIETMSLDDTRSTEEINLDDSNSLPAEEAPATEKGRTRLTFKAK